MTDAVLAGREMKLCGDDVRAVREAAGTQAARLRLVTSRAESL